MSGETEQNISGWTTDTLHSHLLSLIRAQEDSLRREMSLGDSSIRQEIDLLRAANNDWHTAEQRAVDVAYTAHQEALNKAFAGADRAVTTALEAAQRALDQRASNLDKEFHEHLDQVRHETAVAFASSDRAISKAESSNEKRFEAVNEFRAQLNDQQRTFLTRIEYDGRHEALSDKVDANVARLAELELRVTSRLESGAGGQAATYRLIGWGFAVFGIVMSLVVFMANYLFKG
jgi:hypothetical protein